MNQFKLPVARLINRFHCCMLLPLLVLHFFIMTCSPVQAQNPVEAIRSLREGTLVIRFPAYKDKIDTLSSLVARASDGSQKKRLQLLLDEAIYQRDSVRLDYINAFQNLYNFSKVAYFFDHGSRDLMKTTYYKLNGEVLNTETLYSTPVFYLFFERTEESKVDALVIYNEQLKKPSKPFPNNFTRGGFSFLFIKLSSDTFEEWRVSKINKKLTTFWNDYN